ncbi:hypothetical protein ABXN37_25415 [Piscinibacter sakaiensis]|uniref:hypothetical protein n=1 Tax=Piscinibacter sakaiensis TaxID=1547922 RepID=UPI003728095E
MPTSPELQLAERIAAWHNRHPLARRIVPAQVHGTGVVALPFAPGARRPWHGWHCAMAVRPTPVPRTGRCANCCPTRPWRRPSRASGATC